MPFTVSVPTLTEQEDINFWAKVWPTGFCWEWRAQTREGYGVFNINRVGKKFGAHRLAYTLLVGPIPEGLEIDHLCRNRACVNPDHLEPVTTGENNRRRPAPLRSLPGKTKPADYLPPWVTSGKNVTGKCVRGHEYTELNTYTYKDGRTECRICKKINAANYRARRRALAAA